MAGTSRALATFGAHSYSARPRGAEILTKAPASKRQEQLFDEDAVTITRHADPDVGVRPDEIRQMWGRAEQTLMHGFDGGTDTDVLGHGTRAGGGERACRSECDRFPTAAR